MKALVVDDELPARQQLIRALGEYQDVQVVGEAVNGTHALEQADALHPDVVFLDIEMPGLTGLEVAANLPSGVHIVFVTAYNDYAVKAFETHATDYLLKPLDESRLARTVDRLRSPRPAPDLRELLSSLRTQPSRLAVKKGKRIVLLSPKDILYFTSEDRLVFAVTADGKHLLDRTIADLETLLGADGFFRISRSELANLERITELIPWFSGTWRVRMDNGTELDVSRERARRLKELVGA